MASSRAIAAATIAALVFVATFAVLSYTDNAMPDEGIIAESAGPELDVLKNIIHLKAYCLAAWDDARVVANSFKGKYSAITDFVIQYGQEGGGVSRGGRKAEVGNIVMEYAALMGTLRIKYPRGVSKYILDNIDHAVRHDLNGVTFVKRSSSAFGNGGAHGRKHGHLVAIRKKALGLVGRPQVVIELAAKYSEYLHFKSVASKQANNADAVAATMFLKAKGSGHYQSFLQREIAKVQRKMRHDFKFVSKSAYQAEEEAFKKAYADNRKAYFKHLEVQAPAGAEAAGKTAADMTWKPPSLTEMKKIAAKQSAKFLAEFKKKVTKDPTKLIKRLVDEAGGVKLYFTTGGATNSQSTMKPKIKFVGKSGVMEGEIRTVPGQGISFVQHFPTSKPIGPIQKVVLTGTGSGLSWNCDMIKVRVGAQGASVVPMIPKTAQKSFWLKSGVTVELLPDKSSTEAEFSRQGCFGWRATQECDAHGARDHNGDKGCTDEIDSSMSGFCKCDTGAVARVECGHATFTCDEMCKE